MSSGPHLAPDAPTGLERVIDLARGGSRLVEASGPGLMVAIDDYAMLVGQLFGVDGLTVSSWEPGAEPGRGRYSVRVEWSRPGFRCVPAQRDDGPALEQLPWFASRLHRDGSFTVDDVIKLPAAARLERRRLEWQGRRAALGCCDSLPDGSGVALTVFHDARPRRWRDAELDDLRTSCSLLAAAIRRADREGSHPKIDYSRYLEHQERPMAVLDASLETILSVNEPCAALHGYEVRALVGERVRNLSPERHAPHAMAAISKLKQLGHYVFDVMHRRADGSMFPCRVDATRVEAGDGTTCFVVSLNDRSGVESHPIDPGPQRQSLVQSQELQELGLLAGGIAHDFNNLLVGILGNAELARLAVAEGSSAAEALDDLRAAAKRASGLANRMLAYVGKRGSRREALDLRSELDAMAGVLGDSLRRGATIRVECHEDVPVVADATHTRQILMNLVVNASDAMSQQPGGGEIVLRAGRVERVDPDSLLVSFIAEPDRSFVFLEVEDQGCGMSPAVRQRVFDPFFTTKASGQGLGMATVLECVRRHGGGVRVDSTEGVGTSIRVFLPDDGAGERAAGRQATRSNEGVEVRRGKVLVAEDEDVVRTLLRRLLERRGLTVVEASDGVEAQAEFERHDDIDFALVDVSMPRMDGITLIESLAPTDPTPIVLMSGYSSEDLPHRRSTDRVVVFLQKPFDAWELDELIDRFVHPSA